MAKNKNIKGIIDLSIYMSSNAMLIKSGLVKIDEFDKGPRKIFNYGHTFAHAIEKSSLHVDPTWYCGITRFVYSSCFAKDGISISEICQLQKKQIKAQLSSSQNMKILK